MRNLAVRPGAAGSPVGWRITGRKRLTAPLVDEIERPLHWDGRTASTSNARPMLPVVAILLGALTTVSIGGGPSLFHSDLLSSLPVAQPPGMCHSPASH